MTSTSYSSVLSSLVGDDRHVPLSLPVSPCRLLIPSDRVARLDLHPVVESALHILNLDLPSAHFLLRHMQAPPAHEAMFLHGILHRVEGDVANARAWYADVRASDVFEAVWGEDGGGGGGVDARRIRNVNGEKVGDEELDSSTFPGNTRQNGDKWPKEAHDSTDSHSSSAFENAMDFLEQVEKYKSSILSSSGGKTQSPASARATSLRETSLREILRFLSFCEAKFGTHPVKDASGTWVSMSEKHSDKAAEMITGGEGWREF
jgi:hypothetical protein